MSVSSWYQRSSDVSLEIVEIGKMETTIKVLRVVLCIGRLWEVEMLGGLLKGTKALWIPLAIWI